MSDPFAAIPGASHGLKSALAAILHGPRALIDPAACGPVQKRRPAARRDPLEAVNELMAPLVHRKARKARKEAVVAHTTTKEATRKRTPRQVSLHYDRRASLTGPNEPKLNLRSEYLEVCGGIVSGAKAVGGGAESVSAHSGRIPAAGAGPKGQRGRIGALGSPAPGGSGGGNSQGSRPDHCPQPEKTRRVRIIGEEAYLKMGGGTSRQAPGGRPAPPSDQLTLLEVE